MKKILLISIALLFGCTLFAQSNADYPQYPNTTYKCTQMSPDLNEPAPWVSLTSAHTQMLPDCFAPSCYAMSKNYQTTPPVFGPSSTATEYNPEMKKPDYPIYPSVYYQELKPQVLNY